MAKDITMCNDVSPDVGAGAGGAGADFGGDLAGNKGVDLNVGEVSKATLMSYDAPPPEDYSGMAARPPDSAIYTEAPEHAGRTPEQVAAEIAEAHGYNEPAIDNRGVLEQAPHESEYHDSPE